MKVPEYLQFLKSINVDMITVGDPRCSSNHEEPRILNSYYL